MKRQDKKNVNIELEMSNKNHGEYLLSSDKKNISEINTSSKRKCICIIIIFGIILLLAGAAFAVYYFVFYKPSDGNNLPITDNIPLIPININKKKVEEVFSSAFNINSKKDTLIQLLQKSYQIYESISNGIKSSDIIYSQAIYDIYTINSTESSEELKIIYNTKYTSVITVNSFCSKKLIKENDNEDCPLEIKLDLNKREENNSTDEISDDLIRKAILPICIIEHTDRNLILSVTCPETLSENFKEDILRAFSNVKLCSIKGFEFDKKYVDTKKEEKDGKVYINSFDNVCSYSYKDPKATLLCNSTKDIITDKEGNLISSKTTNATKAITDDNNFFINNFTYEFTNIEKESSNSFDEENYKKNLDIILSLVSPIMKKEIKVANFTELIIEFFEEDNDSDYTNDTKFRNLYETELTKPGVHEENIFNKNILNISMSFDLMNDIGLKEGQSIKSISDYNINNESYTTLSNYQIQTKFFDTLNKFISLSNSANKIANEFNNKLNEPILKMREIINENIEKINSKLTNKDLSIIFDSTLAIKELNKLPFSFISATDNLSSSINDIYNNIFYTINEAKQKLSNDVTNFLADSHNIMFKLINNLTELSNVLSSDKSRIVEISTYYLNGTDTSYYEIIQNVKNILDNYYKNEKNLILPLINNLLSIYYNNSINSLEKYITQLNEISDRIESGDLIILLANTEDYKKAINNIYNSKSKVNEIIEIVKNKFNECISLKPNEYFETQDEIDEKEKEYKLITDKASEIANILDKNELIDYTFDELMTSFRNKFLDILNYKENSIKQKFPLEENVLGISLFNATYISELDEFLRSETINIYNFVKEKNDEYINSMNIIINDVTGNKKKFLDEIISELYNIITDIYFDNLNRAYNNSLHYTFQNITNIIEKNTKLAYEYLNDSNILNSYHITNGFINKYNTFYSSIKEISDFVDKNLKNYLSNAYKNVINQIRFQLQSIKSNEVIEKYKTVLPFTESHLNSIKELYEIYNRHISDYYFNKKFNQLIIDYIETTKDYLNNTLNNFQNIHEHMIKKPGNNYAQDYDKERIIPSYEYCAKRVLGICVHHKTHPPQYFYDGYDAISTNNVNQLETINNHERYIDEFTDKYNQFYLKLNGSITTYNSLLYDFDLEIDNKKRELLKPEKDYLDNINNSIKNTINEKLENNLLIASYNYFKNKIANILPNELDEILQQFQNIYEGIYKDIDNNRDNFKSSVQDFFYMGNIYLQIYTQNISYGYGESIVQKLKNDFIYTNKYYYNLIMSKVNKTYSTILNNLPNSEKPFDDLVNMRKEEIKQSNIDLLNELQISKNKILNNTYQEITLKTNQNNFFDSNDLIKNHILNFYSSINKELINLSSLVFQIIKDNPDELFAAKFYLENSINGKQIKEIYEAINKVTFVDLQKDVYQKLIDDTWKIERDEIIKNALNLLLKLNETNSNNFNYEFEKYKEILQNKIYDEFYIKDDLINQIKSLFSKGINNLKENSRDEIYSLLDKILYNIIGQINNEVARFSSELTSYSNNFTFIEKRLNDYKKLIYDEFIKAITYVVNDFNEEILEKFYNDYIEKGLNEFEQNLHDKNFGTVQFLNMTINLNEKIDKLLIINEYKNFTLSQIEFLYQKNMQTLDELFIFSDIKKRINDVIDNGYNSILLPALEKVAIYHQGDEGVSDYDFSDTILTEIDSFIDEKISEVKNITEEMKGEEFIINDFIPADFSMAHEGNIYDQIELMFKNFSLFYTNKEMKEFKQIMGENVMNNFKELINNFIPSFGVDFFDRILKYNEIQKIKMLYHNLKYSIAGTIIYYISLATYQNDKYLPVDIKKQIYNLNNLDSVVTSKNNFIISSLNDKLDKHFEEIQNYIVNKYINEMITTEEFDMKFDTNLKNKIIEIINGNIHNYENDYNNMMQTYIKKPFIEKYETMLREATEEMKSFIDKIKIELKVELDKIFTLDSDLVLADIQTKLNSTIIATEEYNKHFSTFKISDDVYDFLYNFGEKILIPKYREIKELLDEKTAELVMNNLDTLSKEFRNEYSSDNFTSEIKEINDNFSSYIDLFNKEMQDYGYIEDAYEDNLDKEISKNNGLRLLEESNGYKKTNIKLDKTLNDLKTSSSLIKDFILSLDLFDNFEDNIKKYINDKNQQYSYTVYNLEKNKEKNNFYDLMVERLEELNRLSSDYYTIVKINYNTMKEQLINNIIEIDNLLSSCEKVTFDTVHKKYAEIKEEFNQIKDSQNVQKNEIYISPYKEQQTDNYFTVETKVENYMISNQLNLDIIYDNEDKIPKVIAYLETNINPKKFNIDYYTLVEQSDKLGRDITISFNNISSYTNFVYDAGLNQATITTNFNFDEYSIKTQYYEEKTRTVTKVIGGMVITFPDVKTKENIDTPDEEKFQEIPRKNKTYVEKYDY